MQVDRMFSAEAAITFNQNKKNGEGDIYTMSDPALSYIIAQRRQLVNIISKATPPKMDGQREARKRETADVQMEKVETR